MAHRVMPRPSKPHRLNGSSDRLLESHYENNYGGAVRRLNAIERRVAELDWDSASVFEINGPKREELIAANSMILHEIYFDGIGGTGDPSGDLAAALERDFGSVARWRLEFAACAKAQAGGSGWMLLTWSPRHGRLVNQWAADHRHGLAGGTPILALDMYEHAYHLDFGARAASYVDTVMQNIHWGRVGARHARALASLAEPGGRPVPDAAFNIAAEDLRNRLVRGEKVLLLDVRQPDDLTRSRDQLPGAIHRNPEQVGAWAEELPRDTPIIAYCMYGFSVSWDTAAALRARGLDEVTFAGGVATWHATGGPVVPLSIASAA